jgi:hypothetical protein
MREAVDIDGLVSIRYAIVTCLITARSVLLGRNGGLECGALMRGGTRNDLAVADLVHMARASNKRRPMRDDTSRNRHLRDQVGDQFLVRLVEICRSFIRNKLWIRWARASRPLTLPPKRRSHVATSVGRCMGDRRIVHLRRNAACGRGPYQVRIEQAILSDRSRKETIILGHHADEFAP